MHARYPFRARTLDPSTSIEIAATFFLALVVCHVHSLLDFDLDYCIRLVSGVKTYRNTLYAKEKNGCVR